LTIWSPYAVLTACAGSYLFELDLLWCDCCEDDCMGQTASAWQFASTIPAASWTIQTVEAGSSRVLSTESCSSHCGKSSV